MSARDKSLNASAYTLDGTSHLGDFLMMDFGIDITTEDGRGGAVAYEDHEETKRKSTHGFEIFLNNATGDRLNAPVGMTVLNMDGDILASFTSVDFTVNNATQDGSGAASLDEFPNAVSSSWTMTNARLVAASETTLAELDDLASATAGDRKVTISMTLGGWEFSIPAIITNCKHGVNRGQLDNLACTFKPSGGSPTVVNPGGGSADILSVAIEGDAIVSIAATTGSRAYVGTGIITTCKVGISDRTLAKVSGTIDLQGVWAKS